MENIEKETASSKFMENPYIEMKKKISVNGIVTGGFYQFHFLFLA